MTPVCKKAAQKQENVGGDSTKLPQPQKRQERQIDSREEFQELTKREGASSEGCRHQG